MKISKIFHFCSESFQIIPLEAWLWRLRCFVATSGEDSRSDDPRESTWSRKPKHGRGLKTLDLLMLIQTLQFPPKCHSPLCSLRRRKPRHLHQQPQLHPQLRSYSNRHHTRDDLASKFLKMQLMRCLGLSSLPYLENFLTIVHRWSNPNLFSQR